MTVLAIRSGSIALAIAVCFVGCNSILDNRPGRMETTDPTEPPPTTPSRDAEPAPSPTTTTDAAPPPPAPPPDEKDGGTGCGANERTCFGACVSRTDPLFGCGQASCTPCKTAHASATCHGQTCAILKCDPGYADCNGNAVDGCEADLSKAKSCGACNAVCNAAAPYCAPVGAGFQCTTGCTAAAPTLCGAECVDTKRSSNHCGGCNVACPGVDNGTPACTAGQCTFTCKPQFHSCAGKCVPTADPGSCGPSCTPCPAPANGVATCVADKCGVTCNPGFHLCGGKCVAVDDPTACGAACTVCPVPANGTATCAADACGITCSTGFADCDANAANGCEAELAVDPLNCGVCGTNCNGGTCAAGVCQAPPDAGP